MTDRPAAAVVAVERQIDHKFKNPAVLISALTHPTAVRGDRPGEDYQRLEFLGDRVLGVAVADMLLEAFPDADEGELSRRFADLVRKETCADIAAALKLGAAMITGGGKQQNAALRTRNVLGDLCESVIAAIYLDGGFEAAQRFVETNWRERMMTRPSSRHNAKTELQEWAQSKGYSPPTYSVVGKSGPDHEPSFVIEAKVDGLDPEIGEGASRRKAEQAAAARVLVREGIWSQPA